VLRGLETGAYSAFFLRRIAIPEAIPDTKLVNRNLTWDAGQSFARTGLRLRPRSTPAFNTNRHLH
jgi:hypothetical protein